MNKHSHPEKYTQYCPKLKEDVELGWYDKKCECGDDIIGVPNKPPKDHRFYCTKCAGYGDTELARYGRQGEDTYDFRLCHAHEVEFWEKFLEEEATFPWQEGDEF